MLDPEIREKRAAAAMRIQKAIGILVKEERKALKRQLEGFETPKEYSHKGPFLGQAIACQP